METGEARQDSPKSRLEGEVAIITGAAQGIGKAVAARLCADGADVAILDRNAQVGEATSSELRRLGRRVLFRECDVANRGSVRRGVKDVVDTFGYVSALVNSAGVGRKVSFLALSDEIWETVIGINLTGSFIVCQEVARQMIRRGRGAIVNIGSAAGQMAHSDQAAYSVSKAGIDALTRAMAFELGPLGIRVNAVAPGTIATEFLDGMLTLEARQERERRIPIGRLGSPEEVADVIAFLISNEARYVTGSVVPIDGGLLFAGIRT
jgi:NAD(P)-dependent dehydrogenase (short-subunit alcohol dehydrogenase family)